MFNDFIILNYEQRMHVFNLLMYNINLVSLLLIIVKYLLGSVSTKLLVYFERNIVYPLHYKVILREA